MRTSVDACDLVSLHGAPCQVFFFLTRTRRTFFFNTDSPARGESAAIADCYGYSRAEVSHGLQLQSLWMIPTAAVSYNTT